MKIRFFEWISVGYFGFVIVLFLPEFLFGSLGVIRPGDIENGKIDADFAVGLIGQFSGQVRTLYLLLVVGFVLQVIVKLIVSKHVDKF